MDFPLCSVYEIDYPYYARTDISDVEILDMLVEKTELLLAPGAERVIFISEIWNVLEIRQLCKQYGKLLKFLEADAAKVYFEVQGDKVKLLKAGPILMHEFENDQGQKTDETPEILPFVEVYSLRVLDDDAGERALGWD